MEALENKIAIVTGGATGIGKGCVYALNKLGAKVVLVYFRSKDDAEKIANELTSNRSATPWSQRRQWVKSTAEEIRRNGGSDSLTDLLRLLADDPKWEVRKEVADCLLLVDDDIFVMLAARLSQDDNSFVRKSAERGIDRRRRGQKLSKQRSKQLDDVQSQYNSLEKLHGPLAARKARQMAERLYDILVGATVHDIRNYISPLQSTISSLCGHLAEA